MFRGGPLHRGRNELENVLTAGNVGNLEVLWKSAGAAGVITAPTVVDGVVYVGSADDKLYAYPADCATPCAALWASNATGGGLYGGPAVSNGVVYMGSTNSDMYAFPAKCSNPCATKWSALIGGAIRTAPVIAEWRPVRRVGRRSAVRVPDQLRKYVPAGCGDQLRRAGRSVIPRRRERHRVRRLG